MMKMRNQMAFINWPLAFQLPMTKRTEFLHEWPTYATSMFAAKARTTACASCLRPDAYKLHTDSQKSENENIIRANFSLSMAQHTSSSPRIDVVGVYAAHISGGFYL